MVSSQYHLSASPLQPKRGIRPLSDLSARIHIFHERHDRGSMSTSMEQNTSQGFHSRPKAFQEWVDCRPDTTSIQKDWLTNAQYDDGDDYDDKNNNNSKSTTIQRICRNIHRKRDVWQQMALRCRHPANPHQKTLQILKEAAKRAKAKATITEDIASSSEISDESIPAKVLLRQVRNKDTPPLEVQNKAKILDVKTAAIQLQAYYRGYITRKHTTIYKRNDPQQKQAKEIAATCDQTNQSSQPSQLPFPHLKRPGRVDRQWSDITMSDFGDSTHRNPSQGTRQSFRKPSRWIEERKVTDSSDDDDDDESELFALSRPLNKTLINPNMSLAERYQLQQSASFLLPHRDRCQWQHHSWSNLPVRMNPSDGDIRITCARGHSSYSSYFSTTPQSPCKGLFVPDQPSRSSRRHIANVTPSTGYQTCQSGSPRVDDYIDSMLEEEEDDDATNDDVSLAASFFEEEPQVDKDSHNVLHRSDGSLDFRSTLKKKSATFRALKGSIPTSCFHLSLSTLSRWDGGIPDPTTVSQLPRHDQGAAAKSAIRSYLPVRPPPRKLTPTLAIVTPSSGGASDNNNSWSTVFSPTESTEPSPQMPLRKASTHGSSGVAIKSKESQLSPIPFVPGPPFPTCRSGRPSAMSTEFSPQLPIRETSSHHATVSTTRDNPVYSGETPSPSKAMDTLSRRRAVMSISAPILEDGPIRQPERKSSSLVILADTDPPEFSQDRARITTLNSPVTGTDDHPIRLPVRKLSALTLNSSHHSSRSQTPPRPPKPSPQGHLSSPKNDHDA